MVTLTCLILNFSAIFFGDSTSERKCNLSIEPGLNTAMVFSKNIENNYKNSRTRLSGITSLGFGYNINQVSKLNFNYSWFRNTFNSKPIEGSVLASKFQRISIGYQKAIIRKRKFYCFGEFNINWRKGSEGVFVRKYFWETIEDRSLYNSFGIGSGVGACYKISNLFSLGIDVGYFHFFDKPNLQWPSNIPTYKPANNLLIGNLKVLISI